MSLEDRINQQLLAENIELRKRLAAEEQASTENLGIEATEIGEKAAQANDELSEAAVWVANLKEQDEEIIGAFATLEDITERKRGEKELEKSQQKISNLIKYSPALIYEVDLEHNRFISVNDAMCRFLGYERQEILKMSPGDFLEPESRKVFQERTPNFIAGNIIDDSVEYRVKSRDGCRYNVVLKATANFENGKPTEAMIIAHDITEHKKLEERLKWDRQQMEELVQERSLELIKAKENVSIVLESISDAFYAVDADWVITYINQKTEELWNSRREDVIGRVLWDVFPNQENNKGFQVMHQVMQLRKPMCFENYSPYLQYWIEANVYPTSDGGLTVYFRDITERKELENELYTNRDFLMNILDSSSSLIFACDLEGKLMMLNKAFANFHRLPKEKVLGRTFYDFFSQDEADSLTAKNNKVIETGIPHQSEELLTHDGVQKTFIANKFPLRNAQKSIYGVGASITDITERKRMEEALRQSEERFYKAFMASPNPMSISTLEDGVYIEVNESYSQTLGYDREELIGRSSLDLKLWDEPQNRDEIVRIIRTSGKVRNFEVKARTKQGEPKIVLLSMEPFIINGKECLVTIFIDITQQRQMEKEVARLDRLNLVGEMAASIGHEIRNPMTTVRGLLQLLSEKEICQAFREYYGLMIEELDRANSIISEYLIMARDKAVNLKPGVLNKIIKSICPMIQADASYTDKQVKLDLDLTPSLLLDLLEIRQMILNLARNGLEAMQPGGVLTIRTRAENGEVLLEVEDQGHGIPSEILDKLGTPFFTTKEGGTGLGLAVCYSIAQRHNAKIEVDTGPSGTTFRVRFNTINRD